MYFIIFAILIRICANSFSNVFQKQLTAAGMKAFFINFIMYSGLTIIFLPFVNFDVICNLNLYVWINAILGGLFGALGNGCLVKALEKGDLSILGPINAYKPVAAMLFGIIILKEFPSMYGLLGICLIIAGSYFIFETQEEGFSFKLFKRNDIRYRIYALIFTAIEAVFIKNVIIHSDINISFFLWCLFGALFSFRLEKVPKISPFAAGRLLLVIILMGLMQYSTNFVFSKMNVSYGLALFQLSTILSVILGWKFFHETNISKKLLGSFIMLIGGTILILFG